MKKLTRREIIVQTSAALAAGSCGLLAACGREAEPPPDTSPSVEAAAGESSPVQAPIDTPDPWQEAEAIVRRIVEPVFPDTRFLLTDYGAVAGGEADARPGFLAAIEACKAAGGGVVVVPSGLWRMDGPLHFVSNMTLHLEQGAEIRFSPAKELYLPMVLTRWEGTDCWNYSPFVYAFECENVAITGPGRINGQGEKNFLPWRKNQVPSQDRLRQMGIDGVPVDERRFGAEWWLRPHFIQFHSCKNVLIDGPTFEDSPFWVIHLLYSTSATVRNVEVISRHINSDGVDVDSSNDVLIEKCRFVVNDDGVAIKSGRDQDGWRVAKPSYHVVIRDCEYAGDIGGGLAIGSELSGGVHDIFIENYRIAKADHALYFKANLDRGGRIEHIFVRNIAAGATNSFLIFTNNYHSHRGGHHPTSYNHFLLEDLYCERAGIGISIIGLPEMPVRDVTVRDTTIGEAELPMQIKHVEDLVFENVVVNGEELIAVNQTLPETFVKKIGVQSVPANQTGKENN
ncbi:MAG: glycoside hydrolase family 28 protein [Lysobacterales bacterium]